MLCLLSSCCCYKLLLMVGVLLWGGILSGYGYLWDLGCCCSVSCMNWCHGLLSCSLYSKLFPCSPSSCDPVRHTCSIWVRFSCLMSLVSCSGNHYDSLVWSCELAGLCVWPWLSHCCISKVHYNLLHQSIGCELTFWYCCCSLDY